MLDLNKLWQVVDKSFWEIIILIRLFLNNEQKET